MLAKAYYPQPSPSVRAIARAFCLFGWLGFWVQFFFASVSGLALLFAASGLKLRPEAHPGMGISIFWAICSV